MRARLERTQLLAVALGVPERAALKKNLIDPQPVLREKGVLGVYDQGPRPVNTPWAGE